MTKERTKRTTFTDLTNPRIEELEAEKKKLEEKYYLLVGDLNETLGYPKIGRSYHIRSKVKELHHCKIELEAEVVDYKEGNDLLTAEVERLSDEIAERIGFDQMKADRVVVLSDRLARTEADNMRLETERDVIKGLLFEALKVEK